VLFFGAAQGRFVLLVLVSSLLPYAFTWQLSGHWRFTQHAYPVFLIAAAFAIYSALKWMTAEDLRGLLREPRRAIRAVVFWAAVLGVLGVGVWTVFRVLPVLTLRESLAAGEDVTITAGSRDGSFFGEGWSRAFGRGNVTRRASKPPYSVIWVPMFPVGGYTMTVRLDPFPAPLQGRPRRPPVVWVSLNGRTLRKLELGWSPERVGSYDIDLPRAALRNGFNRFVFTLDLSRELSSAEERPAGTEPSEATGFSLWYLRVRSPTMSIRRDEGRAIARLPWTRH
jgi:hypothetical protein